MREAIEKRLSVVRNLLSDSQGYYVEAHRSGDEVEKARHSAAVTFIEGEIWFLENLLGLKAKTP